MACHSPDARPMARLSASIRRGIPPRRLRYRNPKSDSRGYDRRLYPRNGERYGRDRCARSFRVAPAVDPRHTWREDFLLEGGELEDTDLAARPELHGLPGG